MVKLFRLAVHPLRVPALLAGALPGATVRSGHRNHARAVVRRRLAGIQRRKWSIIPDKWTVIDVPAFAHVGGLPVRHDRLATFQAVTP